MALIKCRECGNDVSAEAAHCPKCGVRIAPKRAGRGGSVALVLLILFIIGALSTGSSSNAPPPPPSQQSRQAPAATKMCRDEVAARKIDYARLMEAGKSWNAARAFRDCEKTLNDPELKALVAAAEQRYYIQIATDQKESHGARLHALEMLTRDYPAEAKAYDKLYTQLKMRDDQAQKATQKKAAAMDAARRRREGVSIGMTQQEVIQSSWGRPRSVNRTTYSFGTHEQWVYDGGYLYFKDGVLTAIQN